jgi:cytochrome c oxidase subunit 2
MKSYSFSALVFTSFLLLSACTPAHAPSNGDFVSEPENRMPEVEVLETAPPSDPEPAVQEVKTFDITAKQWEFDPATITVNEGDRVRLTVTSTDVEHGIAIPDFGVSEKLHPNEPVTVEFVADKKGTFRFFCNVFCGSGHGGMRGNLVVQ